MFSETELNNLRGKNMNEKIKKLNPDDLENVAGGYTVRDPGSYDQRFVFTQEEIDLLEKGICPKCKKTFGREAIYEHLKNCFA